MKLILLAATAMLAVPALAQTAPGAPPPTTAPAGTPGDPAAMQGDAAQQQQPAGDQAAPAPAPATDAQPGMTGQSQSMPAPTTGTPMGGYQPSAPALSGTATPGVQPVFQPAMSPSQAYPAPAPLAKYPVCKKGQYDQCMQRGGKK